MNANRNESALEDLEIELLLAGIFRHYGYDFRDYEPRVIRSRIRACMLTERVPTVSRLLEKILREPGCLQRLLLSLSSSGLSMFADGDYYKAFRESVVPLLKTYPFTRIWYVGCSTGEEVYGLAILLVEEGVYARCRIYATDISDEAVVLARKGVLSRAAAAGYSENYSRAGCRSSFSDYYKVIHNRLVLDAALKRNIVFSQHNLVSDGSFNEFHVIVCRNIIKHFSLKLRVRVHDLIFNSLARLGVLVLEQSESLHAVPQKDCYTRMLPELAFYQKTSRFPASTTAQQVSARG